LVSDDEIMVALDATNRDVRSLRNMRGDFVQEINGHTLEYFDDEHIYLVDGLIVPSITQLLKVKFGNKYDGVSRGTLQRASEAGTEVHEAIERYCETGEEADLPEVRNFKFLQRQYKFKVLENEVPVILFLRDEPISAGRLDMVIEMGGHVGGADIKRTSALDKDYLFYQLNLYRIAYRQSHGVEWDLLRGIHLRENTRKFVPIPVNEDMAWMLVHQYMEAKHE
jgi:hypothetical protein